MTAGQLGQAGRADVGLPVEHHVLVHLVGDQQNLCGSQQVGQGLHLGARPHHGARVVRGVDDDRPCARREGDGNRREVGPEVARRERHPHHGAPGQLDRRRVAVVAGLQHDDLVARSHGAQHGRQDALRGASGDGDLGVGVVLAPVQPRDLLGDGLPQCRHAGHRRVLVVARPHGGSHVFQQGRVAREVRETLAEIDGAVLLRQRRHRGEDGGADVRQPRGQRGRCGAGAGRRRIDESGVHGRGGVRAGNRNRGCLSWPRARLRA